MKKIISCVLGLCLILVSVPITALAQNNSGPVYGVYNGEYAMLCSYKNASGVVEIPSEYNGLPVGVISEYAFSGNNRIEKIILPETLIRIEYRAFEYCTALKEIHIPPSVTVLGEYLFTGCTALERVTLPPMVEFFEEYMFYMCTSLKEVTMPLTVGGMHAGGGVFVGCESLLRAELPQGIREVPYRFFSGCSSLQEVVLPNSLESIGVEAFLSCSSLKTIEIPKGLKYISAAAFHGCTALETMIFPPVIKRIGSNAFRDCTALADVSWPLELLKIEHGAFENCVSLTEIPSIVGLESIGESAFEGCTGITQAELSEDVVSLENRAFAGCSRLETLLSYGTVTRVGADVLLNTAFYKNPENWTNNHLYWGTVLMDVKPITAKTFAPLEGATAIASGVFGPEHKITTIIIPDGVTYVNELAIEGCTSLKTLVVGKNVEFGGEMFNNCPSLKNLYWEQEGKGLADNYVLLKNGGIPYQIVGDGEGVVYKYQTKIPTITYVDVHAITKGDPNGDNEINAKDALLMLKATVKKIVPYGKQADAMDLNDDGDITAKDALKALKIAVGK